MFGVGQVFGVDDVSKSRRRTLSKLARVFLLIFFGALGGLVSDVMFDMMKKLLSCQTVY